MYPSCILNLTWIAKDSTSPLDFNTNILVALLVNYCTTVTRHDIVLGIILYVLDNLLKLTIYIPLVFNLCYYLDVYQLCLVDN